MKLISYEVSGQPTFGAVVGDGVVDLRVALENRYADLRDLLEQNGVEAARRAVKDSKPTHRLADIRFLPVIPNPGKIWCCGLNYHDHVVETQREVPEKPMFFLRVADSQVGHGEPMLRPPESTQFDYEAEIAVVIGKPGRRIARADAAAHIAGYTCYNDGSLRDWQRHTSQWAPGKNFARTGAFGPWLVTADEIPFDSDLTLTTRLNGVELQRATTSMMIHSIASQIEYLSTIVPLCAGDVIVTGTPGGVGAKRNPPVWMKPGDVCEVEIERIGTLSNPIADEV
ncbi:fumarylacetoacetate hydrolase family protein [Paraburkholderia sp. J12]|uniref:fumarylacetoacetate hydrolase family protein n=1 Tax=Paraburkholderia sp. J12 TaxID=2805432 RepID=UPI002ABD3747|nr:fumarylacetoacetate hydrolase family protein [Paraburkholderia sp. J12]